jgi:DNA-directed RNA polymerase subunit RPC12/RpoP
MFGLSLLNCPQCGKAFFGKTQEPSKCHHCGYLVMPTVQPITPSDPKPTEKKPPEQLVRTYRSGFTTAYKQFEKEAAQLARKGWRVQTTTAATSLTGLPDLVVVYTRE